MASPMVAITTGTAVAHFPPPADESRKANSPYGLPVVDNCLNCKLRNSNFFCNLPPASLKAWDAIKHAMAYPEGATVFVDGEVARGVYIVCQGRVKMYTSSSDGKIFILKIAQAGEILGLHEVVSGRAHGLTVETLQPSQLAFIRRDDFLRFLKEHAEACLQAAVHLSRDCQSAYDVIRSIGLTHSVSEKLARFLLSWSAEGKPSDDTIRCKLALTHEEVAQLIGASRETVTRALGEFKKKGLIQLMGSTLVIRNKSALERLVSC